MLREMESRTSEERLGEVGRFSLEKRRLGMGCLEVHMICHLVIIRYLNGCHQEESKGLFSAANITVHRSASYQSAVEA